MNVPQPQIPTPNNYPYAVVCVISGSPQETLNALVLGESLQTEGIEFDKILLIYGEYTDLQKQAFELVWDCVCCVPDIRQTLAASDLAHQFNNLYLFTMLGYEKVLLMEAHLLALENIGRIFSNKAPALAANDKSVAWSTNVMLPPGVLLGDGVVHCKADMLLLEPSSEEWDDITEYLVGLREESGEVGAFKSFIAKYFHGSWYSISHEYNFRERFVIFGGKRTYGAPAHEQVCRVVGFCEFIKPSDILFFGEEIAAFRETLPDILKEVIDKIDCWTDFPLLAPVQSPPDRCFALYRCWFKTFFSLAERLSQSLGVTLFQVVRPAPTFPMEQLELMSKEAHESREKKEKERLTRPPRRFHLGKNSLESRDRKIEVTKKAVVTRFRTNAL